MIGYNTSVALKDKPAHCMPDICRIFYVFGRYIVDAEGQTLGRLATMVATYIRGKNSATYTPSQDMGNYVIVINAEKVRWQGPTINP